MSISKWGNWLDELDPYAIQRIVAVKAMFMATILVFVYWFFRPTSFSAFVMPTLIVYYYENPLIRTTREKERFLLFIFMAFIVGNVTLYLLYPFRVTFFYYAIIFFVALYYLFGIYYSLLKSTVMVIIAYSLFTLSDTPPANVQVAYNIFFSAMLSMITMFICLRVYPNRYLEIWSRAMQKYIACMEVDIEKAMQKQQRSHDAAEVQHLSTARAFRQLIFKRGLRHAYRIALNIRNIQFALNNIYFESMNEVFWRKIQHSFKQLRTHMQREEICPMPADMLSETPLQQYVTRCLNQAIDHWNQLCCMQKN